MNNDEKKLPTDKYNQIIDAWLNKKPLEEIKKSESTPYNLQNYCSHEFQPYTGLFNTKYICKYCGFKCKDEKIVESGWPDWDDNAST